MRCTPEELQKEINQFYGGSENRYAHPFNRKFVFSEGFKAVADKAGAYWLLDIIATECAPLFAKAWDAGTAGIGVVRILVTDSSAKITLSTDEPEPVWQKDIAVTDFPPGEWDFYLGRDQGPNEDLYVTLILPSEY